MRPEIVAADSALNGLGWHEGRLGSLEVDTGPNWSEELPYCQGECCGSASCSLMVARHYLLPPQLNAKGALFLCIFYALLIVHRTDNLNGSAL